MTATPTFVPSGQNGTDTDDGTGGGGEDDGDNLYGIDDMTVAQAAWLGVAVIVVMALLLVSIVTCRRRRNKSRAKAYKGNKKMPGSAESVVDGSGIEGVSGGGELGGASSLTSNLDAALLHDSPFSPHHHRPHHPLAALTPASLLSRSNPSSTQSTSGGARRP